MPNTVAMGRLANAVNGRLADAKEVPVHYASSKH